MMNAASTPRTPTTTTSKANGINANDPSNAPIPAPSKSLTRSITDRITKNSAPNVAATPARAVATPVIPNRIANGQRPMSWLKGRARIGLTLLTPKKIVSAAIPTNAKTAAVPKLSRSARTISTRPKPRVA